MYATTIEEGSGSHGSKYLGLKNLKTKLERKSKRETYFTFMCSYTSSTSSRRPTQALVRVFRQVPNWDSSLRLHTTYYRRKVSSFSSEDFNTSRAGMKGSLYMSKINKNGIHIDRCSIAESTHINHPHHVLTIVKKK